ncbi:MAG: carboxypeptidase regulatory-like domain-containing protein [Acidobacteriia bacterium]|nr:carboxypeptidase regulatory-like domain-containing protein [Terriglobia bacterium]
MVVESASCAATTRKRSASLLARWVIGSLLALAKLSPSFADPSALGHQSAEQKTVQGKPPDPITSRVPTREVGTSTKRELTVTVVDENDVAVPSARITVTAPGRTATGETDFAGKWVANDLLPTTYQLRIDKESFYAVVLGAVDVNETNSLEITLNHVREFVEVVNVVYSAPAIDPTQTSSSQNLSSEEIVDLPYPVTRDIRYALPLMPGVLQDALGQIHVNGSSTRQVRDYLDGFDITDPASGLFTLRVSPDAVRSLEIEGSRVPAEYGKASGGALSVNTGMGDDRFRYSATDLLPSLQSRRGINIKTWVPRGTISGPLRKGRAWFTDALEGEYDLTIFTELPPAADRAPAWLLSNLAKTQVNLTSSNILTFDYLLNRFRSSHSGLSPFDPLETTVDQTESADIVAVKDQAYLPRGVLLEVGVAASTFRSAFTPMGDQPYAIHPGTTSGNYFAEGSAGSTRVQITSDLILPSVEWKGRHEFRAGVDLDPITSRNLVSRRPYSILREDGTLSREVQFINRPELSKDIFELSGYAQDRWTIGKRWLVEGGVRSDWDDLIRRTSFSPRLATSVMLTGDGRTKLTAGIGAYYDATSLDLLFRGLTGERFDLFYDAAGVNLLRPAVETTLVADPSTLRPQRFLNWSVDLQRQLPGAIYLELQYIQKRGKNGWTYVNPGAAQGNTFSGAYELANYRRDRYDALEINARRTIKGRFPVFGSYTRSSARSNAVLNFSLDSPVFSAQTAGPQAWDAPNRLDTWGYLPLVRKFTVGYWLDWRNGFPFALVNQDQQLVGAPGARRFPTYFSLNLQVERRIHFLGYEWALRGGYDNITNHRNPSAVNNNVDSPLFLTFAGVQGRVFTGRIRLLGRK